MDRIFEAIEEWMRNLLTGMVSSNLTTMYTDVNEKTGSDCCSGWADTAGLEWQHLQHDTESFRVGHCTDCRYDYHICTCYELISMLTERTTCTTSTPGCSLNTFKMWVAVWIVSHTFTITMAVFDVGQSVVSRAAGVISLIQRSI